MSKIEKLKNVEFLRFVFIILIVCLHIEIWLCKPFSDVFPFYFNNAGFCVEFFFIIAGLFLVVTTDFKVSFIDIFKKKLLRLYPTIVFANTVYWLLSFFTPIVFFKYANIFTFLLINNVGITNQYPNLSPTWFVSSLMWVSLLYFYLIKYVPKIWINFIISILVLLSFAFLTHFRAGNIDNVGYIFNYGIIRAIAGIGLGYLFGCYYLQYKNLLLVNKDKFTGKFLYTVLEIYLFSFLMYYLTFHKIKSPDAYMIYVLAFSGLFWLFILKRGYFSRLLNNDFSVILGRYSYSIFIMHTIVLDLFKVYLWQQHKNFIIAYPVLNLILPVVASILLGIVTYHLVEKPAAEFLKKKWFPKKICRYAEKPHPELLLPRGGV